MLSHVQRLLCIVCALCLFSVSGHAKDITVTDSLGDQTFSSHPTRIAALSWELAENLIELGITPLAVPEIEAYTEWVVRPPMPSQTEDIGSRAEPNLEKLAALQPEVIVITSTLGDLKERLSKIAPVLVFDTYRQDHNNANAAENAFLTLAKLTGLESLARQKLIEQEALFKRLSRLLKAKFGEPLPSVAAVRFASTNSVWVYGDNAMPTYALEKLGLGNAYPMPVTQWGVTQVRLKNLSKIEEGYLLYFEPFYDKKALQRSLIWQAMPFVKQGKVSAVASTWTYGGAMSLGYLAQAISDALLETTP